MIAFLKMLQLEPIKNDNLYHFQICHDTIKTPKKIRPGNKLNLCQFEFNQDCVLAWTGILGL